MAKKLARGKIPYPDGAGFHCQQAAVKYLKAILQDLGLPVPRTHDLLVLLSLLVPHDATLASLLSRLTSLNRYAVEYRYPGRTATLRQARAAVRRMEEIRKQLRARLGLKA